MKTMAAGVSHRNGAALRFATVNLAGGSVVLASRDCLLTVLQLATADAAPDPGVLWTPMTTAAARGPEYATVGVPPTGFR